VLDEGIGFVHIRWYLQLRPIETSKVLIENLTEKKVKILRNDNGTEYECNEFHEF